MELRRERRMKRNDTHIPIQMNIIPESFHRDTENVSLEAGDVVDSIKGKRDTA